MIARQEKKARILIADDEAQIREVLHELLSDEYECLEVGSAEEALAIVGSQSFELVLSDIMMGGITGLEMVPQVLEQSPDTVVIMISGEQNIESAIQALRAGAFDYITKPFDLRHVEAAVKRALQHQELRTLKRHYETYLEETVKTRTADLNKANQTLSVLIAASPLAIYVLDPDGRVTLWNPAAERMFDWAATEVLGQRLPTIPEDERPAYEQIFADNLRGKVVTNYETRRRKKDGTLVDVNLWTARLLDAGGRISGLMTIVADITERKAAEAKINYLAYHDTLTGLPNRVSFEEQLAEAVARTADDASAGSLVVMFLSLDRFKKFNDTLGHMVGDELLRRVAERLTSLLGSGDVAARFGSDEFAFLLPRVHGAEDAAEAARKFERVLELPFNVSGQELHVTASSGISLYPDDGRDAEALLKSAGAALYRAKQLGGNNHQFYTADMSERALKRLALENQLRLAIRRSEFKVYYQPQVNIVTGEITGTEALLRWQHPELGLIQPSEFIPLAEDTGLISPIGAWVLRTACAQTKKWQSSYNHASLRVAVNLSPRQFQQADLAPMIERTLGETRLAASCLELEVTESSVMQNAEGAIDTLRALREKGIRISVDDFGSGYSSLSYLKHLPIDILKIDQSFVRDLTTDPKDAAIVMAIVQLAHSLQLQVKAEGVETEEQARFLRLLRCDEAQGFLYHRPLPAEAVENILLEAKGATITLAGS